MLISQLFKAGPVGREKSEYEGKVRELELGLGRHAGTPECWLIELRLESIII